MSEQMGYPFIYNGTPSEYYNVSLVFIDGDYTNRPSGSNKSIITENIHRNAKKMFLDITQEEPLKFDIEIVFENAVDMYTLSKVKSWLTSGIGYSQLQICAEYFATYYYNCVIHLNEDLIYADGYRGVSATIECDAPWAWQFPQTDEYDLTVGGTTKIMFNNLSEDIEPLKPVLKFHMKQAGKFSVNCKYYDSVYFMVYHESSIIKNNLTYQQAMTYCLQHNIPIESIQPALRYDKTTEFNNLLENDVIVCDNQCGIVKSDLTPNIVQKFNKVFLKMPNGLCHLTITGQADIMSITYENAKRLGGSYY